MILFVDYVFFICDGGGNQVWPLLTVHCCRLDLPAHHASESEIRWLFTGWGGVILGWGLVIHDRSAARFTVGFLAEVIGESIVSGGAEVQTCKNKGKKYLKVQNSYFKYNARCFLTGLARRCTGEGSGRPRRCADLPTSPRRLGGRAAERLPSWRTAPWVCVRCNQTWRWPRSVRSLQTQPTITILNRVHPVLSQSIL